MMAPPMPLAGLPPLAPIDWLSLNVDLLTVIFAPTPSLSRAPPLPRTPALPLATFPVKVQLLMIAVEAAALFSPALF